MTIHALRVPVRETVQLPPLNPERALLIVGRIIQDSLSFVKEQRRAKLRAGREGEVGGGVGEA